LTRPAMGKKKGKKGKGKKGKSSKYLDLEDGPMNHNGFVPNSQPMKIYLCEREKVIPEVEIPEKVKGEEKARLTRMQELRETRGTVPEDQPCKFLRVGDHEYSHVSELKQRIWEVSKITREKQHLFFQTAKEKGGRPISDLRGWREAWPWPKDLHVVEVHDELPLEAYHICEKTPERIAWEEKEAARIAEEMANNPELKKKADEKAKKELEERQAAGKKKPDKKGKKGKKSGKGKGKPDKDELKKQAKEAAKAAKDLAEKTELQDKARQWPENHLYLLVKVDGMQEVDSFKPHECQTSPVPKRKPGLRKLEPTWAQAHKGPVIVQNSNPIGFVGGLVSDQAPVKGAEKRLPPIRGTTPLAELDSLSLDAANGGDTKQPSISTPAAGAGAGK